MKLKITWSEVENLCTSLHNQINSNEIDWIVGISRGGLVPAVILSHKMDKPLYTIGLSSYKKDVKVGGDFHVYGLDPAFYVNCRKKRILIVDEVCDSGETIVALKDLFARCTTIPPKFATLHYKPTAIVVPDFYALETSDWINYPWGCD